jgi:hypothetical protein
MCIILGHSYQAAVFGLTLFNVFYLSLVWENSSFCTRISIFIVPYAVLWSRIIIFRKMDKCITSVKSLLFHMETFRVSLTSCPKQVQMTHDKMNNSVSHYSDNADDIVPDLLVLLFITWTKLWCITQLHPLLKLPPLWLQMDTDWYVHEIMIYMYMR